MASSNQFAGFRIKLVGSEELGKRMLARRSALMAALTTAARDIGFKVRGDAKAVLESRPLPPSADTRLPPRTRTHRLSRAITSYVEATEGAVRTVVGVLAIVAYGRIQELGGRTRPHDIAPRPGKKSLRFVSGSFVGPIRLTPSGKKISRRQGSGIIFSRLVHHPGSLIPARPYIEPAVRDNIGFIESRWREAIARGLRLK